MKGPLGSVDVATCEARLAGARATAVLAALLAGRAVRTASEGPGGVVSPVGGTTAGRTGSVLVTTPDALAPGAGLRPASALFGSQFRLRSASAASCVGERAGTLLTNGLGAFVT